MRSIICLAGRIASGKTTIAQALAKTWPNSSICSFGDVVRRHAEAEGLPLDRATLQEVGLRLITEGWPTFVGELLVDVPRDAEVLIVDGVRHVEPVEELRHRFPTVPVRLVFLDADQVTVRQRLAVRGESTDALAHTVEADLQRVAMAADLIIDTSQPMSNVVVGITRLADSESTRTRPASG
jgi:dephospho-CoA kinase